MPDSSDWLAEVMDCFRAIDEFIPGMSSKVAQFLVGKIAEADPYLLGLLEDAWAAAERRLCEYAEQEILHAGDAIAGGWRDETGRDFLTQRWAPFVQQCQDAANQFGAMRQAVAGFKLEVDTSNLTVAFNLVSLAVGLIMLISTSIVSFGFSEISIAGLWVVTKQAIERAVAEAMEHIGALARNLANLEFKKVFADVAARAAADRIAGDVAKNVLKKETEKGLKAGLGTATSKAATRGALQLRGELKDQLVKQLSEKFAAEGTRDAATGSLERLAGRGFENRLEQQGMDRLGEKVADTTMSRELVRYFGQKAAMGAGFMGGRTLFVEGVEVLGGDRGSIDWGDVGSATAEGLVQGGLMGGRGFVGHVVTGAVSGAAVAALGDGVQLAAGLSGGVSGLESAWAGTDLRSDVFNGALGGAAFGALLGGHGERFQENVAVATNERIGQETHLLFDGGGNGLGTVLRVSVPEQNLQIFSSDVRGTLGVHDGRAVLLDTDGNVVMRAEAPPASGGVDSSGWPATPRTPLPGGAGGGSGSAVSRSGGGGVGGATKAPGSEPSESGPWARPRVVPANEVPVGEDPVHRPEDARLSTDSGTTGDGDPRSGPPPTSSAGVDAPPPGRHQGAAGATPGRPADGDAVVHEGGASTAADPDGGEAAAGDVPGRGAGASVAPATDSTEAHESDGSDGRGARADERPEPGAGSADDGDPRDEAAPVGAPERSAPRRDAPGRAAAGADLRTRFGVHGDGVDPGSVDPDSADRGSVDPGLATREPKIELHVHIEGTVRPARLLEIADRNGIALPVDNVEGLRELYRFRDFHHFIQVWRQVTQVLRHEADFRQVLLDYAQEAASHGVVYMEVIFSPVGAHQDGIPWEAMFGGYTAAIPEAAERYGVTVRLTPEIYQGAPVDLAESMAHVAVRYRDRGVVGIGIGGDETRGPVSAYASAFRIAADGGLGVVPHAGEAVGPASIWDALSVDPVRIRHGIRASEDPRLMAELAGRGVVLDICPTSCLRTGGVRDRDDLAQRLRGLTAAGSRSPSAPTTPRCSVRT